MAFLSWVCSPLHSVLIFGLCLALGASSFICPHPSSTEAAFGPIRDLGMDISHVDPDSVRPISLPDFKDALRSVRASVSPDELQHYRSWNDMYGSFPTPPLEDELAAERKDNDDDW